MTVSLPLGFRAHVTNIGIKDTSDDFTVVVADTTCSAAGMFTQSRFAGPSVVISREHVANLQAQAVVVVSKNANVATGNEGITNAHEIVNGVATALTCSPSDILIASTGVIGRQYPMDNVRAGLASLPSQPQGTSADDVARGIMTTDTV
ncbi:MAG: bifunctional ornithine acetyltransferase/N-acetylglutamate synthase, partial [Actinomycetota bacterium]|nr:bifunctional ornithine acetyltransferase/N-acetylglutamate synthase [Actinomycetota bacterium]